MKTVTIQIGNTDDKLTQKEWADFVRLVSDHIEHFVEDQAASVHFFGGSANYEWWQNAAWIVAITDECEPTLRARISESGKKYRQDSVAWTVGETLFV